MRSARMITRFTAPAALVALAAVTLAFPVPLAAAGEFGVEGQAGYFGMTASQSAEAVFDSSGGFTWGGAVRYSLGMGLYVAAGVRTFSKDGERVFISNPGSEVAKLGHPLSIKITPIFLTAGWRLRQGSLFVPYGGAGVNFTSYTEESSVAGIPYNESSSNTGFHVLGGVEVGKGMFRIGAEAIWSTVPDAVGLGGVSELYGENDLGGVTFVGKIVIAFGGKKGTPMPDSIK